MTPLSIHAATRLLASEIGTSRSSQRIAAGTAQACEKLAARLAPLVGDAGVRSFFDRSLAVTRVKFPWLEGALVAAPENRWTELRACAEAQPAESAFEAAMTLLSTFIGLLERFIGGGLTARLLHDVWPGIVPARSLKENT